VSTGCCPTSLNHRKNEDWVAQLLLVQLCPQRVSRTHGHRVTKVLVGIPRIFIHIQ
jgi:hypothetical protein